MSVSASDVAHLLSCSSTRSDARYRHCGSYSGVLSKRKSMTSKTKWLGSTNKRSFTIDYDAQVLYYTHSGKSKISEKMSFADFISVDALPVPPGKVFDGEYAFGLRLQTTSRSYDLFATSQADAAGWVEGLRAALSMQHDAVKAKFTNSPSAASLSTDADSDFDHMDVSDTDSSVLALPEDIPECERREDLRTAVGVIWPCSEETVDVTPTEAPAKQRTRRRSSLVAAQGLQTQPQQVKAILIPGVGLVTVSPDVSAPATCNQQQNIEMPTENVPELVEPDEDIPDNLSDSDSDEEEDDEEDEPVASIADKMYQQCTELQQYTKDQVVTTLSTWPHLMQGIDNLNRWDAEMRAKAERIADYIAEIKVGEA